MLAWRHVHLSMTHRDASVWFPCVLIHSYTYLYRHCPHSRVLISYGFDLVVYRSVLYDIVTRHCPLYRADSTVPVSVHAQQAVSKLKSQLATAKLDAKRAKKAAVDLSKRLPQDPPAHM